MARFSGLEIEPYIVLEERILSNAFASRDFLWSDHGPHMVRKDWAYVDALMVRQELNQHGLFAGDIAMRMMLR